MTTSVDEGRKALLEARTQLLKVQTAVEEAKLSHIMRELSQQESLAEEARVFTFYGAIQTETVGRCIYELDKWSRRFPGEDITIIFNSPGGSVHDGFALYDFLLDLRGRGHKIIVKIIGMAASMGAILSQAGDERVIGPHSFMMLHEVAAGIDLARSSEIEDFTKLIQQFENKGLDILSERSTLTRQQIKNRWKRKDCWLDAEEALKFGFVDRIG